MAEVTNYIDSLVAELCPDGVEYRPLGDVVEKNYGGGTPSKAKEEYWGGDIPWASVGDLSNDLMEIFDTRSKITPAGVRGSSTNVVPAGAVIVAIKIAPGKMKIAGVDLAINQDIRGLVLNDLMNARFLTYYFRTLRFAGHGTIVKSITNKRLMDTEVPVPPMEVQEAIVEILDKFTNLEARTLQYEYYRDSLFEALDCPRNPLGSFAQYSKDRKKDDSTVTAYVGVENLKSDFQGCTPTESTNPGVIFRKDDILLGNIRPYLRKMWRADSDGVASPDVLVVRIRDEFSENISSRYLYHLLASNEFVGYNVAHSRGGKMPRGNKTKILEFEAPIPPLEEQQRIVDILDRFDALTTSLSEGLPAELAARRSQYEYYRDQLLSFPRKGENQ